METAGPAVAYGFVLAGGSGKRFWPLSREMSPKQLLSVFGTRSLVADALERLAETPGMAPERIAVLTNERLADELGNTLACSDDEWMRRVRVLVEPLGRDSGPAVALCAAFVAARDQDALLIVMPSNQVVSGGDWPELARQALDVAASGRLVTLGLASGEPSDVLISSAGRFLELLEPHPDGKTIRDISAAVASRPPEQWTSDSVRDVFSAVPAVSLGSLLAAADNDVTVLPIDSGWQEIGDFRALETLSAADSGGNHRIGRGVDIDSRGCIVYAPGRLVATLGVEDLIVIDTSDATLVCAKERASDVRLIADELAAHGEPEASTPKVSMRPWGSWTSLLKGDRYQMKMIEVEVGRRVSLQSHEHRSEHWIVVEGTAAVTLDAEIVRVASGESIFIPAGAVHRMENVSDVMLRVVEVQVGGYLGEDDIVRYEDDYDRTPGA